MISTYFKLIIEKLIKYCIISLKPTIKSDKNHVFWLLRKNR